MTALDLSLHAPRSCRMEAGGIIFLPRAIDKTRADLPGGKLGSYLILSSVPTLSSLFYRRMGITHDEFRAAVANAETDDDVATWLHARVSPEAVEKFRSQLLGITMGSMAPPARAVVNALYPGAAASSDATLLIDVVDADDVALFAEHPEVRSPA